jgi:hypothetical protein
MNNYEARTNQTARLSLLISTDYRAPSLQQSPTKVITDISFIGGQFICYTRGVIPS